MNASSFVKEDSSKDLFAAAALLGEKLEEPWFDAPASTRPTAPPPSGLMKVGEFLGDPLADAWLR